MLRCPVKRVSRHLVYLAARGVVQSQTIKGGVVYRVPADSAELQQRGTGEGADVDGAPCRARARPRDNSSARPASPHASLDDLRRLAGAIKPRRLAPIHTLQPDDFGQLGVPVRQLPDGRVLALWTKRAPRSPSRPLLLRDVRTRHS